MEALAAVGLASNVVQFISFAQDLVSTSKQISRNADGALVENLELEAITQNLDRLSSSLLVRSSYDSVDSKEDQELRELCDGCRHVSGLLIEKLISLKVRPKVSGSAGRQWASFRQALNSVLNAEEITDLEARLDRYQKAINSTLLASLRTRINEAEQHRKDRDTRMSQHLLGFIDETKTWQADLVDTLHRNNWQPENAHDTQLFAHQLGNGAQMDREFLFLQRIYHLLRFEEIAERHATIAEAHKKTFNWIFQPGCRASANSHAHEIPVQQGSFVEWLLGDQNLYWVTGKPGSGKSTLMKYLFNDKRTLSSVTNWSGNKKLVTAGFFFWNSGTAMQMSRMGLVQTLLYQCLKGRLRLVPSLFPVRWTNYTLFGGDVRPWTWLELTEALKTLIAMNGFNFLLFIDGLDEFDGPPSAIVSLVLELIKISPQTVKICVASRPWLIFEESFRQMPWLRMEDLTRQDIQLYIEENMQECARWKELQQFVPEEAAKITNEITEKAVGVFLWVILVVASLLNGLRDGDRIEDLWRRIDELPSALEDLFKKILNHLNPEYFVQASEMFQLVLTATVPLSLLQFSFAIDGCKSAIEATLGELRDGEPAFRAETMRRRIMSRCKGLLEAPRTQNESHDDAISARVEFLHRTVKDFFRSTMTWTYIRSGAPDFDAPLQLAASSLRLAKLARVREGAEVVDMFWLGALFCVDYSRQREDSTGTVPVDILDELCRAGDAYWGQKPLHPNKYTTWLAEYIDRSKIRTSRLVWRSILNDKISVNGVLGTSDKVPHWVNTVYLSGVKFSLIPETQMAASSYLLCSFFDFACFSRLNSYVQANMTDRIAQQHYIGGQTLLSRFVQESPFRSDNDMNYLALNIHHKDYAMILTLLERGAGPNTKCGNMYTSWTRLLDTARHCGLENKLSSLCNIAVLYIDHGADLKAVRKDDFNTIFKGMEHEKREALLAKIKAIHEKEGPVAVQKKKRPMTVQAQADNRRGSPSIRQAMKEKYRSLFKK
ncbi:hypothetical protein K505DRAFT_372003 [Melanomma pulvis-pyrius CBS 109.77]|uniref:Uncharacterized protein n=1 Tax=Melanomma pulvis-pyrius CBS 109.77 TaxID=1314802 RepID=A0A6A6XNB3_9PLEO|nr:hypothetical protein K505DRAFT_372003 [Melanomma pulvis-pyrius CBS 109.77]